MNANQKIRKALSDGPATTAELRVLGVADIPIRLYQLARRRHVAVSGKIRVGQLERIVWRLTKRGRQVMEEKDGRR